MSRCLWDADTRRLIRKNSLPSWANKAGAGHRLGLKSQYFDNAIAFRRRSSHSQSALQSVADSLESDGFIFTGRQNQWLLIQENFSHCFRFKWNRAGQVEKNMPSPQVNGCNITATGTPY